MTAIAFAKKFGAELREQRDALGLSQGELGDAIGASASAISDWERGVKMISAYNRAKLKSFFRKRKMAAAAKAGGRLRHG
jgi:transcriptional regulator with XRE-family HTH domain